MTLSGTSRKASAVVLLNFGGPREMGEVPRFLYEILSDSNTIKLPLPQPVQNVLARVMAARRSPEMRRQYGVIGGSSPIVDSTARVAAGVEAALAASGAAAPVFVAHRYLRGWTARTAREIVAAGVERLLAVPMYPQFSYATSGSSFQQLAQALARAGYCGALCAVRSYPDDPGYLSALQARLEACLRREAPSPADTVVLCSAHGLPAAYVEQGDPYRREVESCRKIRTAIHR